MTDSLRDELQNALADRYTIERELGGGGMSRVFLAEEARLKRKVVVKVLAPELTQGLSADRFEREIQMAASLQQANIVPVLSVGETGGTPYYTMPFVEGESLRSYLKTNGPMGIAKSVSVLRDVARALQYAHARGIVHRDIKPDNVLLSGATAVVTDFGIAKAIVASRQSQQAEMTLTQLGTSIGTPSYISPEQAAGDPDIDHRADIYSFGCMAYELLTGHPPFTAKTPQRMLAAHMSEAPPDIGVQRPEIPAQLALLVMRCLEKDAAARPQSADEMLASLDAVSTSDARGTAMPAILLGGRGMLKKALALYAAAFVIVAVVAKAAIVGIGLPDWVFPGSLIVMALGLPVILFTAYTQLVARRLMAATPSFTPGGTPTHAPGGTMATMAVKAMPHLSWRRTAFGGAWAVGAFVAAIGVFMVLRAFGIGPAGSLFARGALARNERIIVGDFAARTSDTTLGPVVTEAFRASLGQSQSLVIMPVTAMRESLRKMQRPADSPVDFALGREMATREGLKAFVDGQILGVGGSYTITTRLVSAQTGEPLATFTETARSDADILSAIDRLAKAMRQRVGESLRAVQTAAAIENVSTPSLEALKKYVQGSRTLQTGTDFAKGVRLLEEAIQLDTGFAMAYRKLAVELANAGGQSARVMELIQKAYDHKDRLTESERLITLGSYYSYGPKQDNRKMIEAYEAELDLNPNDQTALNNVANGYRTLRQFDKAAAMYKRAIAAANGAPSSVFFGNLVLAQSALGQMDSARATAQAYIAALPNSSGGYNSMANVLSAEGNFDSAAVVFRARFAAAGSNAAARTGPAVNLANIAAVRGQLMEQSRWLGEFSKAAAERGGIASTALNTALDSIQNDAWFGSPIAASRRVDAALRAHPMDSIPATERPLSRVMYLYALGGDVDKAKASMAAWEKAHAGLTLLGDSTVRYFMGATLAMAEKRYDDAVRQYRLADVGQCPMCRLPDIGRAYDLAGNADSAIAVFNRYIDSRYSGRLGTDALYLAGTHQRLGELYEAKGDKQKAASHFAKFIDLWKNADPSLQPKVEDAKKRLARLSAGG